MITITKNLVKYINTEVFINPLNLPVYQKSENPINEECEDLKSIIKGLDIILKVSHQEFWCHIIYDPSILNSLHSFCSIATRPYELLFHSKQFSKLEEEIRKQYYLLILRIMSNKELSIPEFSNENLGSLLYDNFIVDIPLLFDICSLYGEENFEIVSKMLLFIFSSQPLYIDDLKYFSAETIKVVGEKINYLVNNKKENGFLTKTTNQKSDEVLFYLLDISYSWYIMLKCVKSKHEITSILSNMAFHKSIEKYFEKFIPYMQGKIDNFETPDPDLLKKQLSILCYYLISIWRFIFVCEFLKPLQNENNQIFKTSEEKFSAISDCINVISGCQENPNFADAMYLLFPIDEDFQVILNIVYQDKDEYYSDFVNESVRQIRKDIETRHTMFSLKLNSNQPSNISSPRDSCIQLSQNPEPIDMSVKQVLEIFPDFSNREIQTYMSLYGCGADHLLDSLLAGAIDVSFVKSEAARVDDRSSMTEKATVALRNHLSIYDGDALDTGRVTAAQLHIGKRQSTFTDTIDPSLRNMILDIVVQQDQEENDNMSLGITSNLNYEDEFDDVYGISHDSVTIDKNTDDIMIKENQNKPVIKTRKDTHITTLFNNKSVVVGVNQDETNSDPVIMEPSKVKFSNYDKRQIKKQRFHDGPQKSTNGYENHRLGHVKRENTIKKDHRSKGDRNNSTFN